MPWRENATYDRMVASLSHCERQLGQLVSGRRGRLLIAVYTGLYMYMYIVYGWLGSVLDSGAEGLWFKSQSRRCRVTVLGKLFTPVVPLFTKQQNW